MENFLNTNLIQLLTKLVLATALGYLHFVEPEATKPQNLAIIGHVDDLL